MIPTRVPKKEIEWRSAYHHQRFAWLLAYNHGRLLQNYLDHLSAPLVSRPIYIPIDNQYCDYASFKTTTTAHPRILAIKRFR